MTRSVVPRLGPRGRRWPTGEGPVAHFRSLITEEHPLRAGLYETPKLCTRACARKNPKSIACRWRSSIPRSMSRAFIEVAPRHTRCESLRRGPPTSENAPKVVIHPNPSCAPFKERSPWLGVARRKRNETPTHRTRRQLESSEQPPSSRCNSRSPEYASRAVQILSPDQRCVPYRSSRPLSNIEPEYNCHPFLRVP
jgi:hypothetical protein